MTKSYYEPGDVRFTKVELTKTGNPYSVDIRAQLISASIFEDIEEPTMLLEIVMQDSINLVQDFPIVGEEIINITFITPGRDTPTKLTFNVYSVEGVSVAPTAKASTYIIKGVSQIHYFNNNNYINKSYNTIISDMVKDILNQAAKSTEQKTLRTYIERTKGILPITIPRAQPFEAIDLLRQKAVSQEYSSGGSFVFFENQYGVHFRSVENLIAEGKVDIKSKKFTHYPNTLTDKERNQFTMRNIINYIHLGKFDTVSKLHLGFYNSEVQSYDIITKSTTLENYKLSNISKYFASTDERGKLPNTNEFIDKFENSSPNRFVVVTDRSKGEDYIPGTIGIKNSFSALLNQNVLRILVYGDNYLAVGDVIEIELPEVSGTTEKKSKDRLSSGNYLVTKLRHNITSEEGGKNKHTISMDCVKVGYL